AIWRRGPRRAPTRTWTGYPGMEAAPPGAGLVSARYVLSSAVPANWIPLLPVQLAVPPDKIVSRLKRGAVLQPDGSRQVHPALGRGLHPGGRLLTLDVAGA